MGGTGLGFRSKADLVTDHLREQLEAGRPGPGQRLIVSRVASRLGVSKVPVREAVTRLVGEGLLELRPNVGPVVPAFTIDEVYETALMRVAIESLALESALPRHDRSSTDALATLLDRMDGTDVDFPELNVVFHAGVIAPTPYREMRLTAERLLSRARRYAIVHSVPGYRAEAQSEHRAILEAVLAKDLHKLDDLNKAHIMSAATQLIEHMSAADSDQAPPRTPGH